MVAGSATWSSRVVLTLRRLHSRTISVSVLLIHNGGMLTVALHLQKRAAWLSLGSANKSFWHRWFS